MHTRLAILIALAAAAGLVVTGHAQTPRAAATPIPTVRGPIPSTADSHAFLAADHDLPPIDLKKSGYVEEEFLVAGKANVYDWAADGTVSVKTADAPYGSRILVRRPADRGRFSGAVVVEPMYPARRWDWSMMWGYMHDDIIDRGDAWVGITLPASASGLQKFNPTRYESLSFRNPAPNAPCPGARGNTAADFEDGLRWDLLSQVGALLKSGVAGGPLAGFRVEALYLTTQGGDLTTYMSAIHPRATTANGKAVYDGYIAKAPFNLARINPCAPAPAANDARQAVRNVGVPVIAVAAQGEVLGTYASRRSDSDEPADRYRLYEVSGAGHIDRFAYIGFPSMEDQAAAGNAQGSPAWPFAAACEPAIPLIDTPTMSLVFSTALTNLDRWVRKGTPAPRASRIDVKDPGTPQASIPTDRFGRGSGGVPTPYLDLPTATFATNSPGPGTCRETGRATPIDPSELVTLYGDKKSYAAKVTQSVDRLVKDRWLTEGDARRVKADRAR